MFDWLMVLLMGKHIAVLGPRGSGKSTLHHLLSHGDLPQNPEQTVGPERTRRARSKETGLTVHSGIDVPGSEHAYPDWKRQFERSSIVFYLFDAHLARVDQDYRDRLTTDGRTMRDWAVNGRRIFLLGTHADTDPLFDEVGPAAYSDRILDENAVVALYARLHASGKEVGSLVDVDASQRMIRRLVDAT